MKIALVVDQLPYPPRNGITLPAYNLIRSLSEHHDVEIIYLLDESVLDVENRHLSKKYICLPRVQRHPVVRLFQEFIGNNLYINGWRYDQAKSEAMRDFLSITDLIWVTSSRSLDVVRYLAPLTHGKTRFIAGIHDCVTSEYREKFSSMWLPIYRAREKLILLTHGIRSLFIARCERNLLKEYSKVVLQTETDCKWMRQVLGDGHPCRIVRLSNPVSESLLSMERAGKEKKMVFIGDLSGPYSAVMTWFLREVFPAVVKEVPEAELMIVGKNASQEVMLAVRENSNVNYCEFVEIIEEIYSIALFSIVYSYKRFGLINKTIQSMAAAVPVVGNLGAFNGIEGFCDGVHGYCCETAEQFTENCVRLLNNECTVDEIGTHARSIVREQFSERSYNNKIKLIIDG